ncbi:MAG: hypothetical protein PHO29_09270 [Acetobacterium sp.]|nr:hypothetical protein [Acetobacterium sp.]
MVTAKGESDDHLTPKTVEALMKKLKQNHFYTDILTKEVDIKKI